jgi:hypothetical protein
MTTYNKSTLKTFFETGDVPSGTDYANFIDSYVNLVDTTDQSMAGGLVTAELVTPRVSATNANFTGKVSANALNVGAVSAGVGEFTSVSASFMSMKEIFVSSFNALNSIMAFQSDIRVIGFVSAGSVFSDNFVNPVAIISAAGTAQGTAALCSASVCRVQGIVDGSTTGVRLPNQNTGRIHYIINETSVSGNLWPPVGGTINALAQDAVFAMAANTMYTVVPRTSLLFSVK